MNDDTNGKRSTTKVALIYGITMLISAFAGVWGGREVITVDVANLKTLVATNNMQIERLAEIVNGIALRQADGLARLRAVEERARSIENERRDERRGKR